MIPRVPSLFHVEEGVVGVATTAPLPASGDLVGLRLIIQSSSPTRQPALAVLRRSALRLPTPSPGFVGLEFLKCCFCCHKKLERDMDVFMYKGEQAFCSAECRSQQMAKEERREIEMLVRKRRDAFHSRRAAPAKIGGAERHARLQISAAS